MSSLPSQCQRRSLELNRRFQTLDLWNPCDRGTAAFFASHDLQAQPVSRLVMTIRIFPSFVRKGRIQAIINTVGTKLLDEDGEQIRRSAVNTGVPLFTFKNAIMPCKVLESRSFVTEAI